MEEHGKCVLIYHGPQRGKHKERKRRSAKEESEIGERSAGKQSSHSETDKATDTHTHTCISWYFICFALPL